jgi:DNA-binding NarL/FixJ family response regulator
VTVRVVIIDDHPVVRDGLATILQHDDSIDVVGTFSSGTEAINSREIQGADIALMDITMPRMNGIETTTRLRGETPHLNIIMMSMHATAEYVAQALLCGAAGYVLKSSALKEIRNAIRSVLDGDSYIDPNISRVSLENHLRVLKHSQTQSILTARQREVLQLMAEGMGTKEIAAQLEVSPKTVEAHRAQVMQRLNIRDVPGLVRYAIRAGLVSASE